MMQLVPGTAKMRILMVYFGTMIALAALLALELNADLLVLLSDVEGLYSGPPSDPRSKIIRTYIRELHEKEITFGDKSTLGRGGMASKVKASGHASERGTHVVITRGLL